MVIAIHLQAMWCYNYTIFTTAACIAEPNSMASLENRSWSVQGPISIRHDKKHHLDNWGTAAAVISQHSIKLKKKYGCV